MLHPLAGPETFDVQLGNNVFFGQARNSPPSLLMENFSLKVYVWERKIAAVFFIVITLYSFPLFLSCWLQNCFQYFAPKSDYKKLTLQHLPQGQPGPVECSGQKDLQAAVKV